MKYLIMVLLVVGLSGCIQRKNAVELPNSSVREVTTSALPAESAELEIVSTQKFGLFEKITEKYDVRGSVSVVGAELELSEDFEISFGPDLYIHFGKDGEYDGNARVARLKNLKGAQVYQIPNEVDLSTMNEVWVWCRAFSVGFARAKLN